MSILGDDGKRKKNHDVHVTLNLASLLARPSASEPIFLELCMPGVGSVHLHAELTLLPVRPAEVVEFDMDLREGQSTLSSS